MIIEVLTIGHGHSSLPEGQNYSYKHTHIHVIQIYVAIYVYTTQYKEKNIYITYIKHVYKTITHIYPHLKQLNVHTKLASRETIKYLMN